MDAINVFYQYLKKHNLKYTPERATILNEINGMSSHFEPEMLLFRLKNKHKKISRATIYRTLELLVNSGLVKKTLFENNAFIYEKSSGQNTHDHFVCLRCGRIIEFFNPQIRQIHDHLREEYQILISDYSHTIYGKCPQCKKRS